MISKVILISLAISLPIESVSGCSVCKPFVGGESFRECTSVPRNGSETTLDLVVDVKSIIIQDWLTIQRRVYNNELCGPTIRVRKGDRLRINLINNLNENEFIGAHNQLRLPNTTNIHLHGLHISSKEPGDSVFVKVDPGDGDTSNYSYTYEINSEQPAGTYWYHAHLHGSTWFQVMSGLSGMFIVEDDINHTPDELKAVSCPDNCQHDIEIVLQSTLQYSNNSVSFIEIQESIQDPLRLSSDVETWLSDPSNGIDYFTVNGLYMPKLSIEINQLKRFRIANAGGFMGLELEIVKTGSNDAACVIREIAIDGVYLDKPRNLNFGQSYVTVGARVDWLIYCTELGTYEFRSTPKEVNTRSIGQFRRYKGTFMTIEVINRSQDTNTNLPTSLPDLPPFLQDLRGEIIEEKNKFAIEFADDFFINREKFNNSVDFRHKMRLGTVQEWTLTNSLLKSPHPLHIHVNHFQTISYNKYTGPYSKQRKNSSSFSLCSLDGKPCQETYNDIYTDQCNVEAGMEHEKYWNTTGMGTLGYSEYGDWRDVLNLPPLSNVTVRFKAADYTGTIVIHCHVLKHEDCGMMMVVEVVEPNGSTVIENPTELGCTVDGGATSVKISTVGAVFSVTVMILVNLWFN